MKLLVLKTNQFLNQPMIEMVQASLNDALKTGFLILDANFNYEVLDLSHIQVQSSYQMGMVEEEEVDGE